MENIFACKVCGNKHNNNSFRAKELMLGLNHEFDYYECSNCGCLQIEKIPENIGEYYPTNYLSFGKPTFPTKLTKLRLFFKTNLAIYYFEKFNFLGFIFSFFFENPIPFLKRGIINLNSRILDVGSGTGKLLLLMQRNGFKNLKGIDLFNDHDFVYENGVEIFKKDIFDLNDKYDLIMLNHSFEHMDKPKVVLEKLKELLNDNGCILIRIPLANSYAWRKYGVNWVQLDAPRHYFLHTIKSMNLLTNKSGLILDEVRHESTEFQFLASEKYLRGYSFSNDYCMFSKKQFKAFQKESKRLNSINDGDSACFYIKKASIK